MNNTALLPWVALLLALALANVVLFWRRHYLSHERDDEGSS